MPIDELSISYPDFVLGQIIDPEEFDQNNSEVIAKVNEIVGGINSHVANTTLDHPDASVTTAKIADDAITSAKIATGAVTNDELYVYHPVQTLDGNIETAFNVGDYEDLMDAIISSIRRLMGTTYFYTSPPMTLTTINNKFHATTGHKHTGVAGDAPVLPASGISMTPITETGVAATVQAVIEALITRLKAVTDSASGADLIGITAISGLYGATVQAALESLNGYKKGAFQITQTGTFANAEGGFTIASGDCSHAEGTGSDARGIGAHAEGNQTIAIGNHSHAEGDGTTAIGSNSHAEGGGTVASGSNSHAEGSSNTASATCSHSEGGLTIASGDYSHSEGRHTMASHIASHAEGKDTEASGKYSHAQNLNTIAQGQSQTALGEYNVAQGTADSRASTDHAWILGNGTSDSVRSNAASIDWAGNMTLAGDKLALSTSKTPASATATGVAGTICWDSDYIYVCVATNTWKRVAINTW